MNPHPPELWRVLYPCTRCVTSLLPRHTDVRTLYNSNHAILAILAYTIVIHFFFVFLESFGDPAVL